MNDSTKASLTNGDRCGEECWLGCFVKCGFLQEIAIFCVAGRLFVGQRARHPALSLPLAE